MDVRQTIRKFCLAGTTVFDAFALCPLVLCHWYYVHSAYKVPNVVREKVAQAACTQRQCIVTPQHLPFTVIPSARHVLEGGEGSKTTYYVGGILRREQAKTWGVSCPSCGATKTCGGGKMEDTDGHVLCWRALAPRSVKAWSQDGPPPI